MNLPCRFVEVIIVRFTAPATNSHGGDRPVSLLSRSHKSYGEKRTHFERLCPVKSPRMESNLTINVPGSSRFYFFGTNEKGSNNPCTRTQCVNRETAIRAPRTRFISRLLSSARLGHQVLASTDRVCAFTPVFISVDIFQSGLVFVHTTALAKF